MALRVVFIVFAFFLGGCVGESWIKGTLYLPDRSRPVQSDNDRSGYGACGRVLKNGAPDMRYGSCPN